MSKVLTIENAEITTAAVELKTLTIKGRQVTLSLFRQLQEENLIDENGKFTGNPWGFVNYQCENNNERNVVWQKGKELRRCKFVMPEKSTSIRGGYFIRSVSPWSADEDLILDLEALCSILYMMDDKRVMVNEGPSYRSFTIEQKFINSNNSPKFIIIDRRVEYPKIYDMIEEKFKLYKEEKKNDPHKWNMEAMRNRITCYSEEIINNHEIYDIEFCVKTAIRECDRLSKIYDEFMKRWQEINALPQLFIAA